MLAAIPLDELVFVHVTHETFDGRSRTVRLVEPMTLENALNRAIDSIGSGTRVAIATNSQVFENYDEFFSVWLRHNYMSKRFD